MKYKILGLPFKRDNFEIPNKYRGICRNEIPESKIKEDFSTTYLNDLYIKFISSKDEQISISDLLEIAYSFKKLSTEPFELIIINEGKETISNNIIYESLGYEVVASNECSMVHFWLRKKTKNFEAIYEANIKRLNNNFLFPSVSEAEIFIDDIKPYSRIVSPVIFDKENDLGYNIVEIVHVMGITGNGTEMLND